MEIPQYISHLKTIDKTFNEWLFQSNEEHSCILK